MALVWIALHDELWSGVAVVAAPGVEQEHAVDHAQYAFWVFTLPILISALLEAPIALLSDRLPRRRLLSGALGILAAALVAAAASPHAWLLSLALAIAGAASGVACAIAQAELIAAEPGRASQALSRWMAFGAAGDALCPPLVAAALGLGASHRAAFLGVALLIGLQALLVRAGPADSASPTEEAQPRLPLWAALRGRSGALWAFLIAAASATLLDEIVVALAALRVHDDLGSSPAFAAAAVTGFSLGSLAGALATERLLRRHSPRRLLIASAYFCLGALALFIAAPSPLSAAGALCVLGASCSPHYQLARAAAALACLALQPLIVLVVALRFGRRSEPHTAQP
jgi:MFS family permease